MVGSTLHRYKSDVRYCPTDFEAEGLNLFYSRPFQVAYGIADNKEIKTLRSDYILWDDIAVSSDAARITRFDIELYRATARPAKEVLAEYDEVVYDPSVEVVWMNGLFYDAYIHQTWRRLCGKPVDFSYLIRSIDLKALSQAAKKQWKPDVSSPEAFLAWQYKAGSYVEKGLKTSLVVCAKEENIEHDPNMLHDALWDIKLTMEIFWKRLYQLEF